MKIGLGENEYNLGTATSPSNNAGHYLAFGADNIGGGSGWNFTGNSTNNGGAIIQGDSKGNLFFITRSTSGSNNMNSSQTAANVRLFIKEDGNIGVGTSTLEQHEQLAVRNGMITTDGIGNGISLVGSLYETNLTDFGTQHYGLFRGNGSLMNLSTDQTSTTKEPIVLSSFYGLGFNVGLGKMALCQNGALYVGSHYAGTTVTMQEVADIDPNALEYRLYVEKGIRTEKVKVDLVGTWADYVFEADYNLISLDEVESFITKNKHLPNVPSAKEVKATGIDVAEMNEVLLRKIEELTLYTIQQQKNIEQLQEQVETLQAKTND